MEKLLTRSSWQRLVLGSAHALGLPVVYANCLALYAKENETNDLKKASKAYASNLPSSIKTPI